MNYFLRICYYIELAKTGQVILVTWLKNVKTNITLLAFHIKTFNVIIMILFNVYQSLNANVVLKY